MKRRLLGMLCALAAWPVSTALAQEHSYTGMVSFGDSLSDVGNTLALLTETEARFLTGYNANFFFPGRYSDGFLWTDRLYTALGFGALGAMPRNNGITATTGTNFAWAGARSGTGNNFVILPNLQTQVGFYTDQLTANNPALPAPATTLFTLWIGGNDVFAHLEQADPIKGPQANAFANVFNSELSTSLDELAVNLDEINIIKLDINQLFLDVIDNPAGFGLTNVTERAYVPFPGENPPFPYGSVVGNPSEYLYWDSAHGTAPGNTRIAEVAYHSRSSPSLRPGCCSWEPGSRHFFIQEIENPPNNHQRP